ncbi:MAG: DUF4383 domain-containing protein [Timaviella obliquedivisa GSE-PSE-MK23-08B]|jgi:hypothetical protein|nr:DUF4383 domain-containing protein [Timaviella obliquedivisa GSE-PSE-MK23-08B]
MFQQSNVQQSELSVPRTVALILGVSLLFLGIVGFVPGFTFIPDTISHPTTSVYPDPGYGYVFGLFPTNYFHNAIRILVGLWGIAAFTSVGGAIAFLQIFAVMYGAEALLGLLPFANTLFGTMPLYGGNVGLSFLSAAIAAYYGFVKPGLVTKGTGLTANFQ